MRTHSISLARASSSKAAVLSGALMLDHLGETAAAERIRNVCAEPESLTGTTSEIGDAIASAI